jgi:hypothetical protein
MTFRISTLITAGLLGAALLVGPLSPVLAGDGCGKDKGERPTSGLTSPVVFDDKRLG